MGKYTQQLDCATARRLVGQQLRQLAAINHYLSALVRIAGIKQQAANSLFVIENCITN